MRRHPFSTLALLLTIAALPACRPAEAPPEEAAAAPEGTEATDATVFESGFEDGALDEWSAGDAAEGDGATDGEAPLPEASPTPQSPPAGD